VYAVGNSGCSGIDHSLATIGADFFSCSYLSGLFANICPTGFPPLSSLCLAGFRQGVNLAAQGVTTFVPALYNQTICNNHFGFNSTLQACYDTLNAECWSGAWGGFGWETSARAALNLVASKCQTTVGYAAAAATGLTLFAGLARSGVSALLSRCQQKPSDSRKNELSARLT
jgi:hypothetical protein